MHIITFVRSIIAVFIHSFHALTLIYEQETSMRNISDKNNEPFLFTPI